MSLPEYTAPQQATMDLVYAGDGDVWQSPCEHAAPCWWIDAEGTARCGYCPATWTPPPACASPEPAAP